jgi:hypothetical protein
MQTHTSTIAPPQIIVPIKTQSSFHVPTIGESVAFSDMLSFLLTGVDMGPFLKDPNSFESAHIVEQVRSACETSGFFQLTNHGVPVDLQESLFKAAESFFTLPYDEKKKLDCKTNLGHRGYDVLASQSYEPGVMPDLKEVSHSNNTEEDLVLIHGITGLLYRS